MPPKKSNLFTYYFLEVFARVWALWGMISFIATFLIIFIPAMCCYLIKEKKGQVIFIIISKIWMRTWLTLVGCPLKVVGANNFKKNETYIVTLNHNTLLDIPITCPFVPDANKTIAKKSFTKVPLFGWFYAKGAVLVDRKDSKSRRDSFYEMKEVLNQKINMCIFPEGTRNKTKEPLKTFYDGAFKLAMETSTPIIPALLFNTNKALPNNKFFYFLPKKLEIHFLNPVTITTNNAKELSENIFDIMLHYYIKHNNTL